MSEYAICGSCFQKMTAARELVSAEQRISTLEAENERLHEAVGDVLENYTDLNKAKARLIVALPEALEGSDGP